MGVQKSKKELVEVYAAVLSAQQSHVHSFLVRQQSVARLQCFPHRRPVQVSQSRNAALLTPDFCFPHLDGPHLLHYFGLHQILDEIAVLVLEEQSFKGPAVGPWSLGGLSPASLGFCLFGFEVDEFVMLLFGPGLSGGRWTSLQLFKQFLQVFLVLRAGCRVLQGRRLSLALAFPALGGVADGSGGGGGVEGGLGVEGGVAGGFGTGGVGVGPFLERHVVVEGGVLLAQTQQLHNGLVLKRGSRHPVLLQFYALNLLHLPPHPHPTNLPRSYLHLSPSAAVDDVRVRM